MQLRNQFFASAPNYVHLTTHTMAMPYTSGATNTTTTISAVHPDIIQTHFLTRLDGPSLASASTTCSQLHALASREHLWEQICHSTWPSTNTPRVRNVISTFPHGYRSFVSDSFPSATAGNSRSNPDRTSELISAVDLFHREKLILSKAVETETVTRWFLCWPFRVDLLDPKDTVQTQINYPVNEDESNEIGQELRLSWIVIDPRGRRAVNVSSRKPVSVRRHWLTGEMEVRFATVAWKAALCSVTVRCGPCGGAEEGGIMQVREVSMQMEDMDGKYLNGRDSLVMLQRALEGKRGNLRNEGGKEYEDFLKRKKERKERELRIERRLDMLCVALATLSFVALSFLFLF